MTKPAEATLGDISLNRLAVIDINNSFIDINNSFIDINK